MGFRYHIEGSGGLIAVKQDRITLLKVIDELT